jgi:hypothetical protein
MLLHVIDVGYAGKFNNDVREGDVVLVIVLKGLTDLAGRAEMTHFGDHIGRRIVVPEWAAQSACNHQVE